MLLQVACAVLRFPKPHGKVGLRDPQYLCTENQAAGYGTMLMQEAEEIARNEHGSCKLAVSDEAAQHGMAHEIQLLSARLNVYSRLSLALAHVTTTESWATVSTVS